MFAEVITIGDEILIGQIVDTNSAYIAAALDRVGVTVLRTTSIRDNREQILEALRDAESRVQIVIITGGLGPTRDDVTKHVLCEYLHDHLVEDADVLHHIGELFRKYYTTPISDLNRKQALVPSRATALHNAHGTAPGMWMQGQSAVFIALPGVPLEMKALMDVEVIPRIVSAYDRPVLMHRTLHTYGLGESAIAERLDSWELALPDHIKLAYLPNLGKVRLRLTGQGKDAKALEVELGTFASELRDRLSDIFFGEENDENLESTIRKLFTDRNATLATAESCTGGRIAAQLTSVPGASAYFRGSVVAYATDLKSGVLGVPGVMIDTHSVVSKEVAAAMATGARTLLGADFAVATTGNAGPEKGDSDAEVGTVCIAVAGPGGVRAELFNMGNHRERIVEKSVNKALEMIRKEILNF